MTLRDRALAQRVAPFELPYSSFQVSDRDWVVETAPLQEGFTEVLLSITF